MLLSNNRNVFPLYQGLVERGESVHLYSGRLTKGLVRSSSPRFIVCYNYNYIIPGEILELVRGRIINLHISYLPWNRGADPNFWSFMEDTPKGVTIHQLSAGLDQGDILLQKGFCFDEHTETFRTTYNALNDGIQRLFLDNWDSIKGQSIIAKKQKGMGSHHKRKDLIEFLKNGSLDMDEPIYAYKKRKMSGI